MSDKQITREALYALVWAKPMLRVAENFGVSSSYLARICSQLQIPRPERGYWAKLEVGKAPQRRPLPPAPPGMPVSWSPGTALDVPITRSARRYESESGVAQGADGPQMHSLVVDVKEHFAKGKTSRECGYLKPAKWTLPDLTVTQKTLDSVIALADALYKGLELEGASLVLTSAGGRPDFGELDDGSHVTYNNLWVPRRGTVAYFGEVPIGLAIGELAELVEARYVNGRYCREDSPEAEKAKKSAHVHSWTSKQAFATGRLFLVAYAASGFSNWTKRWNEKRPGELIDKVPSICRLLRRSVGEIATLIADGRANDRVERERREAQWRAYELREERERRETAREASKAQLLEIFRQWNEAAQIRQFLDEAGALGAELDEVARSEYEAKLSEARSILPNIDLLQVLSAWISPRRI
jgi:hypothetical protein